MHLFVIDPLESLNRPLDSSLRMMFELSKLGHEVRVCEPRELAWHSSLTGPAARCRGLAFKGSAVDFDVGPREKRPLAAFKAIHMRKDPPYDLDYIATTWLLDPAARSARVYNDPEALRRYNEKLAILRFPEESRPALVSADPDELLAFVETECNGDAVVKPLTLFGGRGVERVTTAGAGGKATARELLAKETADGKSARMAQAFDPAIFDGEVRAFTAFGEPVAWCLKKPAKGYFLANTRMGAQLLPYTPKAEEVARVKRVAAQLGKDGVQLIGFDLIGGWISEINLTSPRLLQGAGDNTNYYARIAQLMAADLKG